MCFLPIDVETWSRKEYYEHYTINTPCTYSLTVSIDITRIKQSGEKLYPCMLYLLSKVVNHHEEFRTSLNEEGVLGVFDTMNPCYTVFHQETEMFSNIWTEYCENYEQFKLNYGADIETYAKSNRLHAKPNAPDNCFPVSMIPWVPFSAFSLHLTKGSQYMLPIFTMGQYEKKGDKTLLPLAIQVHHAVCDGFHVARFVQELQSLLNRF